jgi:hypothetical protein
VVFGSHPLEPARRLPPPPVHSSNPPQASPAGYSARGVWAPPRSLAATKGILSVPRGTEMFQFPRCPLTGRPVSARPCAGRVAPFGDLRIAGCQRLPGAFRRVAASFLGRQRQGIHHAPFMRRPSSVSVVPRSPLERASGRTGSRQRDVAAPRLPARLRTPLAPRDLGRIRPVASRPRAAPAARARKPRPPRLARGPVLPVRQRLTVVGGVCLFSVSCSARGRPNTSPAPTPFPVRRQSRVARCPTRASRRPAAAEPDGFRVARCQRARRHNGLQTTQRSS